MGTFLSLQMQQFLLKPAHTFICEISADERHQNISPWKAPEMYTRHIFLSVCKEAKQKIWGRSKQSETHKAAILSVLPFLKKSIIFFLFWLTHFSFLFPQEKRKRGSPEKDV